MSEMKKGRVPKYSAWELLSVEELPLDSSFVVSFFAFGEGLAQVSENELGITPYKVELLRERLNREFDELLYESES